MEIKAYSLRDISKWQDELNDQEKIVKLPSLQRGFVWKTEQIEALWDSIFRGYPIGAILMSVDEKTNERLLLDGQQRSTSIALGFFNPYDENRKSDFFSLKDYLPSIWVDLQPREVTYNQKFLFRVLTKSHPWGYQLKENSKTLSMNDRRYAFEYFKTKQDTKSYIEFLPSNINPWDTYYPVPLSFILDLESIDTFEYFKVKLKSKLNSLKVQTKHSQCQDVNYEEVTDESFKTIFDGLHNVKSLQIPEIQVKATILKEDDDTLQDEAQDPTLFVRLNSKGTQISGEELIYSIYKAAFPESKKLVEEIGTSFIAPSKVINLFSRLANCEVNDYKNYVTPYNINTFRKAIKEPKYKLALEHLINTNDKVANKLIDVAIKIIKQNKDDFSNIILKQIIVSDIDLFFVLLAYINKNNLITKLSEGKIKEVSSNYVYILWFKRDKKVSNKLFSLLLKDNLTWNKAVEELIKTDLLLPLLKPEIFRENLLGIMGKKINYDDESFYNNFFNIEVKDIFKVNEEMNDREAFNLWKDFTWQIKVNRTLLLYAQRNYLNEKFKEFNQIENIEDTNRPWDYDHIYPNSWVHNKVGISNLIRNWVNTNGNYRALSYDDNRSENNHLSPKQRLESDEKKMDSFIKENDFEFWNKLDGSSRRILHDSNEMETNFLNAVLNRTVNIYEEWYNSYYHREITQ